MLSGYWVGVGTLGEQGMRMQLSRLDLDVWTPDDSTIESALGRVTHLCVGAHQDDIEIMAHSAICHCIDNPDAAAFGGVVVTDGAGAARAGPYVGKTDAEMKQIRREEQRTATALGKYAVQLQLAHPSADVKGGARDAVVSDLQQIFAASSPDVLLIHNPTDKHDTHVAVFLRCMAALRNLPRELRPRRVLGVEVWRGLDWLLDTDKTMLDDSAKPELRARLLEVFDSQIFGGKRYDLATEGRRCANATFHESHVTDQASALTWAMDLTPLVQDDSIEIGAYVLGFIDRLREDVASRLARLG